VTEPDDQAVAAFIARYTQHQQEIYRFILMMMPNPTDAKDVLQETAVALWRKREDYDGSRPFLPWACRFARFHVLNHCKKKKKAGVLLEPEALDAIMHDYTSPEEPLQSRATVLRGCLAKLPERDRKLIADRYENRATLREVAERTNDNVQTLYKRLQRIRKRLYDCVNRNMEASYG
jgi:RNA polymerase sigma-70 factor (ECF subfamily)